MGQINGAPVKGLDFRTQPAISYGATAKDHCTPQTQAETFVETTDIAGETPSSPHS